MTLVYWAFNNFNGDDCLNMTLSILKLTVRLLAVCLAITTSSGAAYAASQQELSGVKNEISRQQQSLSQRQKNWINYSVHLDNKSCLSQLENQIKKYPT